jgi:hypothetical protein
MKGGLFEAPASEIVHSVLGLTPQAASSREFWLWLTFAGSGGALASMVDWRFGSKESIDPVNYGITTRASVWEGLFARLWWRGHVGFDESAEDKYDLAKRGDVDLWRSHIIRQDYGRCRNLARALVRYQYAQSDPSIRTLTNKQLRELAKSLRIVDASVSFESLDQDALSDIIRENAERHIGT